MISLIALFKGIWAAYKKTREIRKLRLEDLEGALAASQQRLKIEKALRREEGQLRSREVQSRGRGFVEVLESKHAALESHEGALNVLGLMLNTGRSLADEANTNGNARAEDLLLRLAYHLHTFVTGQNGEPLDIEQLQRLWFSGAAPATVQQAFAYDVFELWGLSIRALQSSKSTSYSPAFFLDEYRRDPNRPTDELVSAARAREQEAQNLPALTGGHIPGRPLVGPHE